MKILVRIGPLNISWEPVSTFLRNPAVDLLFDRVSPCASLADLCKMSPAWLFQLSFGTPLKSQDHCIIGDSFGRHCCSCSEIAQLWRVWASLISSDLVPPPPAPLAFSPHRSTPYHFLQKHLFPVCPVSLHPTRTGAVSFILGSQHLSCGLAPAKYDRIKEWSPNQ